MMKFRENEDAVSPVIGVILMVAITVILAAVIAAFVFGMTGNVQTTKTVAATTQISGGNIVVTYQGGPDHAAVNSVTCSVINAADSTDVPIDDVEITVGDATEPLKIGYRWTGTPSNTVAANYIVTVTAKFSDGTEQVILDKILNVPAPSTP